MTTIAERIEAADIKGALDLAMTAVKTNPTDADARWMLAELLLLTGEAERADRMLDAAALHEPNPAVLEFRRLLRAEVIRTQVTREGREPRYQGDDATPAQKAAMRARVLLRSGNVPASIAAAEEAESLRTAVRGYLEDASGQQTAFEDLRDADDLMAAEIEVLTTAGEYMLAPVSRLRSLAFDEPRRVRDLVWRRCTIELKDGTEGIVFLPALYLGANPESDPAFQLGRATDWTDAAAGPVRGRGQRLWLVGEEAVPFMKLHGVVFE